MPLRSFGLHASGSLRRPLVAAALAVAVATGSTVALIAPASAGAPAAGPARSHASASVSIAPAPKTVRKGQTVALHVAFTLRGAKARAAQAHVLFPGDAFDCGDVVVESPWPVIAEKKCERGKVKIAVGAFEDRTGKLPLARITLKAKKPGTFTVGFDRKETMILENERHTPVQLRSEPARITVRR